MRKPYLCKYCGETKPTKFRLRVYNIEGRPYKNRRKSTCIRCESTVVSFRGRLKKFGLTVDEYRTMNKQQGGRCKICGDKPDKKSKYKTLTIDHNHKTGEVRALLCCHCNSMLGYARDNRAILLKAISYLEEYGEYST